MEYVSFPQAWSFTAARTTDAISVANRERASILGASAHFIAVGGEIVQRFRDTQGRELVRVSTEQRGIESVEGVTDFTVTASLVTSLPE
jgi:hypothetical protein